MKDFILLVLLFILFVLMLDGAFTQQRATGRLPDWTTAIKIDKIFGTVNEGLVSVRDFKAPIMINISSGK